MPLDSKNQILVVDDELLIRDLLHEFFTSQGFVVHLVMNGQAAKEIIDQVDFQTVILDLKMPINSGLEVAAHLNLKKPMVPIIIMTAYPSIDSAIESVRKGIFDYLVKPFKLADLHEVVKRAVREYDFRLKCGYSRTLNNEL
jgi:DNA-binding NtrC family response regulator